jgi:hypothetical protein
MQKQGKNIMVNNWAANFKGGRDKLCPVDCLCI